MIRTFGLGPRVKKCLLWAFGIGPSAENVCKSHGKCKKHCVGKDDRFRTFFGSVDGHIVPKTESVFWHVSSCFCVFCISHDFLTMFSACFIVHVCPFSVFVTTKTAQHNNKQHTQTQTHTHMHMQSTVIMRVV